MKKYFALFSIPASVMDDWKKNTKPADMKAAEDKMMQEWDQWMKTHAKSLKDKGAPLGKTKRVTAQSIANTRNDLNWYSIVEAESHEDAAKLFKDSPHLQIPQAAIEVMEIPAMPM